MDKRVDTGGLSKVPLGSVVTYTVVIRNAGGAVASSVGMTNPLLSGVTFKAWVDQGGASVTERTVEWGAAFPATDVRPAVIPSDNRPECREVPWPPGWRCLLVL